MNKKPLNPTEIAEEILQNGGGNFLEIGRLLKEVQDYAPDLVEQVIKLSRLGTRKAYYLIQIERQFAPLGIKDDRLLGIGWTKLQMIGPHLSVKNCNDLLTLAEKHTAHELEAILNGDDPVPNARVLTLYLSKADYDRFEKVALQYGAAKYGRGLIHKEQALVNMTRQLVKLSKAKEN
ncbi:hypothetical protein [Asticcacaulis tiandongensis]|uniref:hypothetical protein n=1 Tax=Asticcacaulis tiandongensis TaxID=2565365 RepID=UPI00112E89E3|nr:hypothetical protein [Asticcacaulis tiandongensis]